MHDDNDNGGLWKESVKKDFKISKACTWMTSRPYICFLLGKDWPFENQAVIKKNIKPSISKVLI